MKRYRRRLPHWDAPDVPTFVTWRLWGSLPATRVFLPEHLTSGKTFAIWDRLLDTHTSGPVYLRQPQIARLITDHLKALVGDGSCSLHAYVVVPNHVHVLWTPHISLAALVRRVKGATAYRVNQLLSRTGQPFWQPEYFDRLVRNESDFARIRRYIEWNPVKAALVTLPKEFPWSSAYDQQRS
ncbi:MAG TPA: transposase [Bryobacteraceae bacterium]